MNESTPLSRTVNGIFSLIFLAVILGGMYVFVALIVTGVNSLLDSIPTKQEEAQTILNNYCGAMNGDNCPAYTDWVNTQTGGKLADCIDIFVSMDVGLTTKGQVIFTPSSQGERQTALLTCLTQYSATIADYLDTQ